MMKYLIIPSLLLLPLAPLAANAALDLNTQLGNVGNSAYGTTAATPLLTIVGTIINVALGLLGVIFLLLTIFAGFMWMSAAGNEEQVAKAKGILKTSIVGLIITLAAYSIASFIVTQVSGATA